MNPVVSRQPSRESIELHLGKVLGSPLFVQSHRLQRLLSYLVQAYLENTADRVKGYTLAVEVFDKGVDFDPDSNALVRVEMGRLRGKLTEYYAQAGPDIQLVFKLPKGNYQILVEPRDAASDNTFLTRSQTLESRHPGLQAGQPSIAVLPFEDLSPGQDQAWFADGIAEDLLADLSKISGLRVCGRYSWRQQEARLWEPAAAANRLGVRYLLQGSVRCESGFIRLSARLTDSVSGSIVWTERYDRQSDNALALQGELSAAIVNCLRLRLTPLEQERLGHLGTANPQAHEAFLRGLQQFWQYAEEANLAAQRLFEHAVTLDPAFVGPRAMLARSLVYDHTMQWNGAGVDTLPRARELAEQAIAQDGLHPLPHAVLSWIRLWQGDSSAAVAAGKQAVSLDPNSIDARTFLSIALCLDNQAGEGLPHSEVVLMLNPMPSAFHFWCHGMCHLYSGQNESAVRVFTQGINTGASFLPNHVFRIHALVEQGRLKEARDAAAEYRLQTGTAVVSMRSPVQHRPWGRSWVASIEAVGLTVGGLEQN